MRIAFKLFRLPRLHLGIALLACLSLSEAQADSKLNQCLDNQIKSIQILSKGTIQGEPVIHLNSVEKIKLSFDDLDPSLRKLEYRIIHCDKDWEPTPMASEEYLRGFQSGRFDDIANSFNTKVAYRSYLLEIPNSECQPIISGNYCIEVFQGIAPDLVLFRRCFYITESQTTPQIVLRRNGSCQISQAQQLEIKIPMENMNIQSAQQELNLRITQNGQYYARLGNPELTFSNPKSADYRGINQACFPGGLEYLNFDISNLRSQSVHVQSVVFASEGDSAFLHPTLPETKYSARKDINGAFLIDREEYRDRSRTDADYVWVTFELKCSKSNLDIFVSGDFCGWERRGDNWMQYDETTKSYRTCIQLKQAYYNYQYFAYNQEGEIQWGAIQINSSDTENDYGIFVYQKRPGSRYDRLIGYRTINSEAFIHSSHSAY